MDLPAIRLMGDTCPLPTFSTTINVPYCQPSALSGTVFLLSCKQLVSYSAGFVFFSDLQQFLQISKATFYSTDR